MQNKNEVLIEDVSEEGLKKLENFCSEVKKEKIKIVKKSKNKNAIAICIDLVTFNYYFTEKIYSHFWGGRWPATAANYTFKNLNEFFKWYKDIYLPLKNLVIIKHIPHASLKMPKDIKLFFGEEKYNLKMTDIGIDMIFSTLEGLYLPENCPEIPEFEIKAKYSRLYCDVERFKDDNKEPMAKFGQGYIYKNYYDGEPFSLLGDIDYVEIEKYYDNHHKKLNKMVKEQVDQGKDVLILDLHSYSDDLASSLGQKGPFPDVCIGYDERYCKKELLNLVVEEVKRRNLTYEFNFPYKGSIIPSDVLNGKIKGNVYSIMIEVHKRLYL